jgi:sugar lactone lactonase YvrE
MEVGPSGEVVLADTGNDGVVKFAADGTEAWRIHDLVDDDSSLDNARDIGVDSHGNVYVADDANFRIIKLGPDGTQLMPAWTGPTGDKIGSPIGISVHVSGGQELVYVADGAKKKIRVFDTNGKQVRAVPSPANGCGFAALRDVDADAAGNLYVANYTNNDIVVIHADGSPATCFGTKGTGPGQFANPYGIRVATDPVAGHELLYVADSNNDRVQVFELDGTDVATIGTSGTPTTPGTFTTLRRVAVDAAGNVWGADLWGSRAERFDRTPTGWDYDAAATIGGTGTAAATPSSVFNEVRQVAFDAAGDVYAVDTVNQRIVRFDPSGTQVKATYCARTNLPTSVNWPRGLAIDANGDLWVADTKQSRLQILKPGTCTAYSRPGGLGTSANQFDWPHQIAIRPGDRVAFVADTLNNRITSWNVVQKAASGNTLGGFANPRGIGVDPTSTDVLVADTKNDRIVRVGTDGAAFTGVKGTYTDGGGLLRPEGVAEDAAGRLYVADTGHDRVVILDAATGSELGVLDAQGGLAFDGPASVSVDAHGLVYVSDTQNDRVLVYSWSAPPPVDAAAPDATITSPTANQVLTGFPAALAGQAGDDLAVATVNVSIQDRVSKQWYRASNGTWQATMVRNPAALGTPGAATTSWTASFDPPSTGSGQYLLRVEAVDGVGKVDKTVATVKFDVHASVAPDTVAPDTTVTAPANKATVASGTPVAFAGRGTDDVGVTSVQVGIQDTVTKQWLHADGTFGSYALLDATVAAPGSTSTTWSFGWTPPRPGSFGIRAIAHDAAGNVDTSPAWRAFSAT